MKNKLVLSTILGFFVVMGLVLAVLTFSEIPNALENEAYNVDLTTKVSGEVGTLTCTEVVGDSLPVWLTLSGCTLTGNPNDEDYRGKESITINFVDKETPTPNDVDHTFDFEVEPNFCDVGDGDNINIKDLDFKNSKYKPGEEVSIDVEVEADEDLENVEVEVFLYNVDTGEEIESETGDEMDIDEDDKEDFKDIILKIPNDEDLDDNDNYRIYAVARGEDDGGDDHCAQKWDDIRINREDHDVTITDFTLSPSTATCGDTVDVIVDIENIGNKDEDDVYVKLVERALGVDDRSINYDLEDYTDSDNDATARFSFRIPEGAQEKDYSIEAIVYFDDGDETESEFATLTVMGCGPVEPELPAQDALLQVEEATRIGDSFSLPVKVTNKGSERAQFTLEIANVENWAEAVNSQSILLDAGQSGTYYFYLNIKEDVLGKQSATVNLKSGANIVKSQPVTIDLGEEEKKKGFGFDFKGIDSTVFWIIGDIVLIVLALYFIKLLFTGKKKK